MNMSIITLSINKKKYTVDVDPSTPLLWVIRDTVGLKGTKFGCGEGFCGCCTVHVNGEATFSCSTSVKDVENKEITTLEGMQETPLRKIIDAWLEQEVSQCGYCQPGQIMSAASLLLKNPKPTDEQISTAMSGNLCRCGTYTRIKKAIHKVIEEGGIK
jgi:aerobic-type carbon monoxide dehydrogenase small subunit (CoxS/CutS family)